MGKLQLVWHCWRLALLALHQGMPSGVGSGGAEHCLIWEPLPRAVLGIPVLFPTSQSASSTSVVCHPHPLLGLVEGVWAQVLCSPGLLC